MNWYQNLYIGETASEKKDNIIQKVENRQNLLTAYLITVAPDARNQLEIVTPTVFYRQEKRYGSPMIVGIACGMREARALLLRMTQDVCDKTENADFRSYFLGGSGENR